MSEEVISMEEFNRSIESKDISVEDQEDWDWAVNNSLRVMKEADNFVRLRLLLVNIAEDTLHAIKDMGGEDDLEGIKDDLRLAIDSGIRVFENPTACPHCSGELILTNPSYINPVMQDTCRKRVAVRLGKKQ